MYATGELTCCKEVQTRKQLFKRQRLDDWSVDDSKSYPFHGLPLCGRHVYW